MAKTIIRFYDNNGDPISDSINVQLYGAIGLSPSNHNSTKIGTNTGIRVFEDLLAGEYDIKFNSVTQNELSPVYIAGPVVVNVTIPNNSVNTVHLIDGAVTNVKLANDSVTNSKIVDNTIEGVKLKTGSVTASKLATESVTLPKIASGVFNNTISRPNIFSPYGVNVDNSTIGVNGSGVLSVKDSGIGSAKLSNNAVTTIKINNEAVDSTKLTSAAVTNTKLADGSVSTEKIQSLAVTNDKLADQSVTLGKMEADTIQQLRILATYEPGSVAYVSPNYSDNTAPYFDTIQAAIDYIKTTDSQEGIVYIYPGYYNENIVLDASISLIGMDPVRCKFGKPPTISDSITLDIQSAGSQSITIKNLGIYSVSDGSAAVNSLAVKIRNILSEKIVFLSNWVFASGRGWTTPQNGIGMDIEDCTVLASDCTIVGKGGENLSSGVGGKGYGVMLSGINDSSWVRCRVAGIGGFGPLGYGKGYSFYAKSTIKPITKEYLEYCTLDSTDESIKSESETFSPTVLNCQYKKEVDEVLTVKDNFENSLVSERVNIKEIQGVEL